MRFFRPYSYTAILIVWSINSSCTLLQFAASVHAPDILDHAIPDAIHILMQVDDHADVVWYDPDLLTNGERALGFREIDKAVLFIHFVKICSRGGGEAAVPRTTGG